MSEKQSIAEQYIKATESQRTERRGVHILGEIVEGQLKWAFREQPINDYGVDAHIEILDGDKPTGRLIAVQIKSGASWFAEGWEKQTEESDKEIVFYGSLKHYNYWLNHSLPVLLVLVHPQSSTCYWQYINQNSTDPLTASFKVIIPKEQVLEGEKFKTIFEEISYNQDVEQIRMNILKSSKYLIELRNKGYEIKLICKKTENNNLRLIDIEVLSKDLKVIDKVTWKYYFDPSIDFETSLKEYLSWAELTLAMTHPDSNTYFVDLNKIGNSFLILNEYLETGHVQ